MLMKQFYRNILNCNDIIYNNNLIMPQNIRRTLFVYVLIILTFGFPFVREGTAAILLEASNILYDSLYKKELNL